MPITTYNLGSYEKCCVFCCVIKLIVLDLLDVQNVSKWYYMVILGITLPNNFFLFGNKMQIFMHRNLQKDIGLVIPK